MKKPKEEKIENNNKFVADLKAEIDTIKNEKLRLAADFENFRKRTESQKIDIIRFANEEIILEILPVLDNFSRSASHVPEDIKANNWVTGIQYVSRQLGDVLKNHGIEKIEVRVGDEFNPNIHEAIGCEPNDKCKPDQIFEVVEDGYKLNGKVIRPVKVKVAK